MSSSSHFYVIGAGLIGIVGAVTVFLMEHFRQEKRSQAMAQNLNRMDAQISVMRAELEQMRTSRKLKKHDVPHRKRSVQSYTRSLSADEFKSQSDTSDLEYFDISDDEFGSVSFKQPLDLALIDVDRRLKNIDDEVMEETLTILDNLCSEYPDSPELWYRVGKCYHQVAIRSVTPQTKKENIGKGVTACMKALEHVNDDGDLHKLYAILIGLKSDFEPTKQRIADGYLFKEHVDIAINLNPNDASLHHMLGRFKYEIASLKWFERKIAATLFGEPPEGSYDESLECFLEAERLSPNDWKENKAYIGKCYIALGEVRKGIEWLEKAYDVPSESQVDEQCLNSEIEQLLSKYQVYR